MVKVARYGEQTQVVADAPLTLPQVTVRTQSRQAVLHEVRVMLTALPHSVPVPSHLPMVWQVIVISAGVVQVQPLGVSVTVSIAAAPAPAQTQSGEEDDDVLDEAAGELDEVDEEQHGSHVGPGPRANANVPGGSGSRRPRRDFSTGQWAGRSKAGARVAQRTRGGGGNAKLIASPSQPRHPIDRAGSSSARRPWCRTGS